MMAKKTEKEQQERLGVERRDKRVGETYSMGWLCRHTLHVTSFHGRKEKGIRG